MNENNENEALNKTDVMQSVTASELRIGNFVSYYGNKEPFIIEGMNTLNRESWKEGYVISRNWADKTAFHALLPIPITEEWLLRFGFINDGGRFYRYNYGEKSRYILVNLHNYTTELCSNSLSTAEFKTQSVHQLQNLYFALTGRELTVA